MNAGLRLAWKLIQLNSLTLDAAVTYIVYGCVFGFKEAPWLNDKTL